MLDGTLNLGAKYFAFELDPIMIRPDIGIF